MIHTTCLGYTHIICKKMYLNLIKFAFCTIFDKHINFGKLIYDIMFLP